MASSAPRSGALRNRRGSPSMSRSPGMAFAVKAMMGTRLPVGASIARILAVASIPSITGIRTSMKMAAYFPGAKLSTAAAPCGAKSTWHPRLSSIFPARRLLESSSSTRSTCLPSAGWGAEDWLVVGNSEERRLQRAQRFVQVAAQLGEKPAPLAIAWCLRNPHVSSVILGASGTGQLQENLAALELAGKYDEPVWRQLEVAAAP